MWLAALAAAVLPSCAIMDRDDIVACGGSVVCGQ
jgi:hypothetical protein